MASHSKLDRHFQGVTDTSLNSGASLHLDLPSDENFIALKQDNKELKDHVKVITEELHCIKEEFSLLLEGVHSDPLMFLRSKVHKFDLKYKSKQEEVEERMIAAANELKVKEPIASRFGEDIFLNKAGDGLVTKDGVPIVSADMDVDVSLNLLESVKQERDLARNNNTLMSRAEDLLDYQRAHEQMAIARELGLSADLIEMPNCGSREVYKVCIYDKWENYDRDTMRWKK